VFRSSEAALHRYRRRLTSNTVGRHPNGSCANRRTTVSLAAPWHPQRRHHLSGWTARHRRIARSGSNRCPSTSSPRSSRRANVVRSGRAKVASDTSRSSRWTA